MECFHPSAAAISMLSSLAALFASGAFLAPKPVYLLGPAWATVSTVASCLMRQKAPMSLAQGANDIESKSTQIDIVVLIDKIDRLCHLPHVTKTPAQYGSYFPYLGRVFEKKKKEKERKEKEERRKGEEEEGEKGRGKLVII